MKLSEEQINFLIRTARRLSESTGREFSRNEVIRLLIDAAMCNEKLFDLEDPSAVRSTLRRGIIQSEERYLGLGLQELLAARASD